MSSRYSYSEAVLGSSVGTPAIARGILTDVCIDMFAESNGASAIVGKTKLSGAGASNSSALHKTLHGHALPNTSAANLLSLVLSKRAKTSIRSLIPNPSIVAMKVRSRQQLETCVRLGTLQVTSRR